MTAIVAVGILCVKSAASLNEKSRWLPDRCPRRGWSGRFSWGVTAQRSVPSTRKDLTLETVVAIERNFLCANGFPVSCGILRS
jgi:hypothetical protein